MTVKNVLYTDVFAKAMSLVKKNAHLRITVANCFPRPAAGPHGPKVGVFL